MRKIRNKNGYDYYVIATQGEYALCCRCDHYVVAYDLTETPQRELRIKNHTYCEKLNQQNAVIEKETK